MPRIAGQQCVRLADVFGVFLAVRDSADAKAEMERAELEAAVSTAAAQAVKAEARREHLSAAEEAEAEVKIRQVEVDAAAKTKQLEEKMAAMEAARASQLKASEEEAAARAEAERASAAEAAARSAAAAAAADTKRVADLAAAEAALAVERRRAEAESAQLFTIDASVGLLLSNLAGEASDAATIRKDMAVNAKKPMPALPGGSSVTQPMPDIRVHGMAATALQASWRRHSQKKRAMNELMQDIAAETIQTYWRQRQSA
eukprot:COSAG02_NODE_18281_length_948_cov_1.599529_2_plen_258_part_01